MENELDSIILEVVDGIKEGSRWLIVDDVHICHKQQVFKGHDVWRCKDCRSYRCLFTWDSNVFFKLVTYRPTLSKFRGGLGHLKKTSFRTNTFQKGASLSWSASKKLTQIYHEKFKRCELCGESPHNCCDTSAGEDGHRNSPPSYSARFIIHICIL